MNEEEKESIEEFRKQLRLAINIDYVTTTMRDDNAQTILNLIEKIKDIFSLHCPECGGRMKSEFLDMEIDHIVYKCEKCGEEWI